MICAMKARSQNSKSKNRRKCVNLTLSSETRKMASKLKTQMGRPSVSNVVETLILEKTNALAKQNHTDAVTPAPELVEAGK